MNHHRIHENSPEFATEIQAETPSLPVFILLSESAVSINPAAITSSREFPRFVARLFKAGYRFSGLNYQVFQQFLYEWEPGADSDSIFLASNIVEFDTARYELYKKVKITPDGEVAEYLFEPVFLETIERTPVFGPIGEDNTASVVDWLEEKVTTPAKLDIDEFIAAMWDKGVRFGIDFGLLQDVLAEKVSGRQTIARMLKPDPGCDATILELFSALRRDNAPKQLINGRVDLGQFSNRFPQIEADVAIFKKIPRRLGKPGFKVGGEQVQPAEMPRDIDLNNIAGPGTRVESRQDGEYIVSAMHGFLFLDTRSNHVSVTEKIINIEGVSLRTTGDLNLSGKTFENHGDVQENRFIEGNDMSFMGDVYGKILSRGGEVLIQGNIVKGSAASSNGHISVKGRASHADLRAVGGSIEVTYAEGCTLVADNVRIERAVSCEIISGQLDAAYLEGCTVAAQTVKIETSHNRRDVETAINLLLPDFAQSRAREQVLLKDLETLLQARVGVAKQVAELQKHPELSKYLAFDMKLKKGEIKLNDQQEEQVLKATQRFAPMLQQLRKLSADLGDIQAKTAQKEAELDDLLSQREAQTSSIACDILAVTGDTVVRTLQLLPQETILSDKQIAAIKPRLRHRESNRSQLYAASEGSFSWHYVEADEASE